MNPIPRTIVAILVGFLISSGPPLTSCSPWFAEAAMADLSQEWSLSPLYNWNRGACNMQADVVDVLGQTVGYIVVQNGQVVAEAYHDEEDRIGYFESQSLTKAWSSMLIGKLVEMGMVATTDTLADIFDQTEDWLGVEQADEKKTIRLEELLSMTSGLKPCIVQSNLYPQETLQDVLNTADYFEAQRGFFWYLDQTHILARILIRRSGMTPKEFAIETGIFDSLGIVDSDYMWRTWGGIEGSAVGFQTNPRVNAKLSQLYLQKGMSSETNQLIPQEWVELSSTDQLRPEDNNFISLRGSMDGYGYQWVVNKVDYSGDELQDVVAALGFQGQITAYDPQTNTSLAINGRFPTGGGVSYALMKNIISYARAGDFQVEQRGCDTRFGFIAYAFKNGCDVATDIYNQIRNIVNSIFAHTDCEI